MIWKSDGEEEEEQYLMYSLVEFFVGDYNDLRMVRVMVGSTNK